MGMKGLGLGGLVGALSGQPAATAGGGVAGAVTGALTRKKKKKALDAEQAAQAASGGDASVPSTAVGPVARAAGRGFFGY